MIRLVGWIGEKCKAIAGCIGDYQSRSVLAILYFTALLPFGLATRMFTDPLKTRERGRRPSWTRRSPEAISLKRAQMPF